MRYVCSTPETGLGREMALVPQEWYSGHQPRPIVRCASLNTATAAERTSVVDCVLRVGSLHSRLEEPAADGPPALARSSTA